MGHSGLFVSAMEQVAPDFPKAQFIAVSGNEGKPPSTRLACRADEQVSQDGRRLWTSGGPQYHRAGGRISNLCDQSGRASNYPPYQGHGRRRRGERGGVVAHRSKRGRDYRQAECGRGGLVQAAKEKNICVTGRGFDQTKSRRTSFSQISSRIGRAVRQHFRPGEGRQAVRRLHAIRLRHGSGDRRFAALRGRQSCQPERSRRCRQATQRSAIPEAAWP